MQATIYSITPFDQAVGTTIQYNWSSVQKYVELRVRSGPLTTDTTVYYSGKIETNLKQITIPANSGLVNGMSYYAFITVYDSNNNTNENKNTGVLFLCRKTPAFAFEWNNTETPVTNGKRFLSTFSFTFTVKYSQDNGERLNLWSISLYSSDYVQMATSGLLYNVAHTVSDGVASATLSYPFSGFSDKNDYLIRAQGKTQNGISVDTGYVSITTDYATRSVFAVLLADNVPDEGKIHVHSNITAARCKVYDSDGNEIPEEELGNHNLLYSGPYTDPADNSLTSGVHALILPDGYYMEIDDGFTLGGSFSNTLIFINPKKNEPLVTYSGDSNHEVTLYYREGVFGQTWSDGTPSVDDDYYIKWIDSTNGGYSVGIASWDSTNGWDTEESVVYWRSTSSDTPRACFELVVKGTVNDVYISNMIDKPSVDERIGVVVIRDGVSYNLTAYNGFRLPDGLVTPIESYAESTNEGVG